MSWLGIDPGTSGVKAVVLDDAGTLLAKAMALLEAVLLLRLSLGWTRLLVDALGVPTDAALPAWPGT